MNEFVLLKNIPEKKESIVYGKINSINSDLALAEMELKDNSIKLVFSSKKMNQIKVNSFARAIGTLIYNNNEPIFNVKSISIINDFDLNLFLKITELEENVIK